MSEHEHSDRIAEMLSGLHELEPSLESRLENRRVIASEIARLGESRSGPLPWWSRSLSVPIPIAIAASLMLLMYGTSQLIHQSDSASVAESVEPVQPSHLDSTNDREPEEQSSFEVTETYLCGVGRLSTHTIYTFKEN